MCTFPIWTNQATVPGPDLSAVSPSTSFPGGLRANEFVLIVAPPCDPSNPNADFIMSINPGSVTVEGEASSVPVNFAMTRCKGYTGPVTVTLTSSNSAVHVSPTYLSITGNSGTVSISADTGLSGQFDIKVHAQTASTGRDSDIPVHAVKCTPLNTADLNVPLHPQQTNNWCWAASAEMIMHYLGSDVAQCVQANKEENFTDCCDLGDGACDVASGVLTGGLSNVAYLLFRGGCNQGGSPQFDKFGFTAQTETVLSWGELKNELSDQQLCGKTPVAFSWTWNGGSSHMMVAKGYSEVGGTRTVSILDPWLPCLGDHRIITYDDYVETPGNHTHDVDYYKIRK